MASAWSLVARTVQELKAARELLWSQGSAADPPADRIIDVYEADGLSVCIDQRVTPDPGPFPSASGDRVSASQSGVRVSETIGTADAAARGAAQDDSGQASGAAVSSPQRAGGGAAAGRPTARHVTGRQIAPRLRAAAVVIVLGLVVVVGVREAVISRPPTVSELMERAGWGGEVRVLNVGVNGDIPGVSKCGERIQREPGVVDSAVPLHCVGFDANIATYIARWLGKERDFYKLVPEQRGQLQGNYRVVDKDGKSLVEKEVPLDLVVAAYSMTDDRKRQGVVFAGPYLETDPTVLTRADVKYIPDLETLGRVVNQEGVGDDPYQGALKGKVCTVSTGTGVGYLKTVAKLKRNLIVTRVSNKECVSELLNGPGKNGRVVAVVTDAALLAGFQAKNPEKLIMHNVTNVSAIEERWGVAVGRVPVGVIDDHVDASGIPVSCAHLDKRFTDTVWARRQLVLLALKDLRASGKWSEYFVELQGGHAGDSAVDPKNVPRRLPMGAPEVGQPIAVPNQPPLDPAPCPVTRWLWETGSAAGPVTS